MDPKANRCEVFFRCSGNDCVYATIPKGETKCKYCSSSDECLSAIAQVNRMFSSLKFHGVLPGKSNEKTN